MKTIAALLLLLALISSTTQNNVWEQLGNITNCIPALDKATDACNTIAWEQNNGQYYQMFYGCIANHTKLVSPECPKLYCRDVMQLDRYGVECNNLHYDYSNANIYNGTQQSDNYTISCVIGDIAGCTEALGGATPYCSNSVYPNSSFYFQEFYDCIQDFWAVKKTQYCAQCFCSAMDLDTQFKVNCNSTVKSSKDFAKYAQQQSNLNASNEANNSLYVCRSELIKHCDKAIDAAEKAMPIIDQQNISYYRSFYEYLANFEQVKNISNCAACYCNQTRLYRFGVDCNYTIQNTTQINQYQPSYRGIFAQIMSYIKNIFNF